jgi:hypothetical protein
LPDQIICATLITMIIYQRRITDWCPALIPKQSKKPAVMLYLLS